MALQNGTFLGPYEIVAPLGTGAMGEVYKALDARLNRTVAIKVLTAALASDPQFRERFEREARALSQLTHPHICTLYDVGQQDQTNFLVMEYLEGETLDRTIARGPMQLDQALHVANEIADALDSAHRVGIVHRDLKPGNVMLARGGVKLLDFGVAKFTDRIAGCREDTLTMVGSLIGTVQYMAPEQLAAGNVDARTDIFALGSVLYEMITSEKAFRGTTQASVIAAILERDSSSVSRQVLTPPGVDRLVRKCLRKNPDERWQSARDLGDELRWLATSATGTSQTNDVPAPARSKGRRRFIFRLTIGFSLSILMVVVPFTYVVLRNRTPPPPLVAMVEPPATTTTPPPAETPPPVEDLNKALNEHDLQSARDMKRPVEERIAARAAQPKPVPPEAPVEVETPGIARKAGEGYPEYQARVRGMQVNLTQGKNSLDKNEYAVALARFRLVERDAPKYQGVDALIADATARQQKAVEIAIDSGQQNEAANRLMEARRWYEQALQYSPSSVIAREKRAAVMLKMNQAAAELYAQGAAALKTQNIPLAKRLFQQVFDSTMPGDEYREKAAKQLELIK